MKKYWKIEGQDGLWTLQSETLHHWWFTQGEAGWLFSKVPSPACKARPATFREIHGRPKPPEIWDGVNRADYEEKHPHVVTVYYARLMKRWQVLTDGWEELQFPTHAEAIAYAQKHATGNL